MNTYLTVGVLILLSCWDNLNDNNSISTTSENTCLTCDQKLPEENGIIYFSYDNGANWINKSAGLPESFELTDIAVTENFLGLITKQHGAFQYDFPKNSWLMISDRSQFEMDAETIFHFKGKIFIGTDGGGIFVSQDKGASWMTLNDGLKNLVIRKITAIGGRLYIGTDDGFYSFNETSNQWTIEFRKPSLQVNGIAELENEIYIGTNKGAFKSFFFG